MKNLQDSSLESDHLKNVKFAVFGLGDSSYVYYNKSAKDVEEGFLKLGAQKLSAIGLGDDKGEEGWEGTYDEWMPEVFNES